MRYFFDNCVAPKYAAMLKGLGEPVIHLQEKFAPDTIDEIWIPQIGQENLILVSADRAIHRRKLQRQALLENKVTTFYLIDTWVNVPFWEQAQALLKYWPNIKATSSRCHQGACHSVKWRGDIEVIPPP